MAEALLRRHLAEAGIAAEVRSAGTLGWNDRPATDHAVTVMAELGLDIGAHTSRRLAPELLHADLVVTMTRDHAGAVLARDPELRSRVFLPAEFARLATEGSAHPVAWIDRVTAVGDRRDGPLIGRPAEEVPDPAGEPLDVYRSTAQRLDRELRGLVTALSVRVAGPGPVR